MESMTTILRDAESRKGHDVEDIRQGLMEHLKYHLAKDKYTATDHDRYFALASAIRDRMVEQWMKTQQTHHKKKVKRVYYLSLEFLMGRALYNNIVNLKLVDPVREAAASLGFDLADLLEEEVDAGLGNGGLGRLAACFLDSLATLEIPATGYGLRYNYGIFRQGIENGYQVEHPDDWLVRGNPWEIGRPEYRFTVQFGGRVESITEGGRKRSCWLDTAPVIGIPYDLPVAGYGGKTVNTLRLWSAHASEDFDFEDFNKGDYIAAVENKVTAENLTKVLYPNDLHFLGKELRLKQQYLFVSCSIQDIVRRFKVDCDDFMQFPDFVAIQLNDTHPSLAVPELLRILIDIEGLEWDQAWDIAVRTFAYTNHTLMPEALEKWSVPLLERLLPRHLQIIYEINHRFLEQVALRFPGEKARIGRMSLIEEGAEKQVRMAHLSMVGSHSTNGVAALHTELLQARVVPDFAAMFPERFNNKTNGITQRRWLLSSNQPLSRLITETIGNGWIDQLGHLQKLKPLAEDADFREKFYQARLTAKKSLAAYLVKECGFVVDPEAIFDVQIKRLHEYKRQLMNAIHAVMLYNRIRKNPDLEFSPQVFLFGAKAAPGYEMAKLIIKLINNVGNVINNDPAIGAKIKVLFLPNYRVSMAERLIPAADVSEQISTAGTEASGTGNMKFMLNGALTIGTMDGANIEICEEVGAENMFIFGMNATEAKALHAHYDPTDYYARDPEVKEAVDLLFSGHFNVNEPGIFNPIQESLMEEDRYMIFADLPSYRDAHVRLQEEYRDTESWWRKSVLNTACSGKFSSDRTINQYAKEVWDAPSVAIE